MAALLLYGLAAILVLVGLAGTLLPALPGAVLIVAGLWLAAWTDGFVHVSAGTVLAIAILGAASYAIDFAAAALGAQRMGASRAAMVGAGLGTVLGLFFGLTGLVVGPFAGAVAGEWFVHRDLHRAGQAGVAAWIGFAVGAVVKVGVAVAMIAIFLAALVF